MKAFFTRVVLGVDIIIAKIPYEKAGPSKQYKDTQDYSNIN